MRVFTVTINTNNDAFDNSGMEISRILRTIAKRIEDDGINGYYYKEIHDINGNNIGKYDMKIVHD